MKVKNVLAGALICLLLLGLLTGCGMLPTPDDRAAEGEQTRGPAAAESAPGETARTAPAPEETTAPVPANVDLSDPDKVALNFLEEYTAGNYDRAALYLTPGGREELRYVVSDFNSNPYALALWKLAVKGEDAKITGRGIVNDWTIVNIEVKKYDIEAMMQTEEGRELFAGVQLLLALSGFQLDDFSDAAAQSGMTFDESLWNTTFSAFENAIKKYPQVTENIRIEIQESGGEWRVDDFPYTDILR